MDRPQEIAIGELHPHPDNPRLVIREDVVDAIAKQIKDGGAYASEHAILVRPVNGHYQILSGHHRVEAARKAELKAVPAWVREMGDEEAFMQLVLANAQGELSPLEYGMHALKAVPKEKGGRGKKGGLSAYAKAIGKDKGNVSRYRDAAAVAESQNSCIDTTVLLDRAQHLAAIHPARPSAWSPLVRAMFEGGWSVADTQHWVSKVKEFDIPKEWGEIFLPYEEVIKHFLATKEFSAKTVMRLCKVADAALASIEDYEPTSGPKVVEAAKDEFVTWLRENTGGDSWDLRKITAKQSEIEARLGETEAVESWHHGKWGDHLDTLADGSVALLLTDPPYGIDYQSNYRLDTRKDKRHKRIENDGAEDSLAELAAMLEAFEPKLADESHVLVFCHWSNEEDVRRVIAGAGFKIRNSLIWAKNATGMGDLNTTFAPKHERIIYAAKGSPVLFSREPDVLEADRTQNALHPTQKPVDLLQRLIEATTAEGQLVADPFGGSASTLVAAKESGRRWWGCEVDEGYHRAGTERLR